MSEKKYYSIGSNPVGKPKDKSYFVNVFDSYADADYFIYFVEACEVKECIICAGSGMQRTMIVSCHPYGHELEACDNCHGHGVVKA